MPDIKRTESSFELSVKLDSDLCDRIKKSLEKELRRFPTDDNTILQAVWDQMNSYVMCDIYAPNPQRTTITFVLVVQGMTKFFYSKVWDTIVNTLSIDVRLALLEATKQKLTGITVDEWYHAFGDIQPAQKRRKRKQNAHP